MPRYSPAVGATGCGADPSGQFRRGPDNRSEAGAAAAPQAGQRGGTRQGGAAQQLDGRPRRRTARRYVLRYAADLGKALDDGDNLRVLPIISYGAVGNVTDLIYLKGVDFSITYADVLDHFKNVEKIPGIERRVNYVIPMFQGEVHILARPEIKTIEDLAGKKVNFNTVGSAANYTGGIVFDRLGIKVGAAFPEQRDCARGNAQGRDRWHRPRRRQAQRSVHQVQARAGLSFPAAGVHGEVRGLLCPRRAHIRGLPEPDPARPDHRDDFGPGPARRLQLEQGHTPERYRRCVRFVEYLFDRFDKLRAPPYQPGWKQINLAGTVPGWTRFPPAQEQLDKIAAKSAGVDPALARAQASRAAPKSAAEQERLFQQFLEWSKNREKQ